MVALMLFYGVDKLGVSRFTAKIGFDNTPSINLFTKIGFRVISESQVFREVTVNLPVFLILRSRWLSMSRAVCKVLRSSGHHSPLVWWSTARSSTV